MVIGCIVFTLPHFLTPDNSEDHSPIVVHHDSSSYTLNSHRLTPNQASSPNQHLHNSGVSDGLDKNPSSSIYAYSNYNNGSRLENETIVSLGQIQNNPVANPVQRQGRNSICHSGNPQSSPFIQNGATQRLNLDLENVSGKLCFYYWPVY